MSLLGLGDARSRATLLLLGGLTIGSLALLQILPIHNRLALYTAALSAFHALEYLMTALYHPTAVSFESFLLDHSSAYFLAVACGIAEYALWSWEKTFLRLGVSPLWLGTMMVLAGQALRTMAMRQAGHAFTHEVAHVRTQGHYLVKHGVYRYVRHPAYLGFYVWALGTQVILGNPFCLVAYVGVLYRFFSERIRAEEALLVDFFPTEYPRYQKETWSGIPGL